MRRKLRSILYPSLMSGLANAGYRWTTVTLADRSGILYILSILGFIYTSIVFVTRVIIKWRILGLDDGAMLIAQVFYSIQFALMLISLSSGLARSFDVVTTDQYSKLASTYSANQIVVYLSLGFSKLATILLVRRLFIRDMKSAWSTCNTVVCAIVVWTIASAIVVSAGCSAARLSPKTISDLCPRLRTRYMAVVITDGLTDTVLAFLPAYLCRNLQMNLVFKLQVLGIFALRLPLLLLAGFFYKYCAASLDSDDMDVTRTTALVFQQTQLCVSLIVGTIPCLRSFIRSFDTGSGVKAGFGSSNLSGYGRHSSAPQSSSTKNCNTESFQMSSFSRAGKEKANTDLKEGHNETIRVNKRSSAMSLHGESEEHMVDMERCSSLESDRKSQLSTQELVIRKDVRWEVTREAARENNKAGFLESSRQAG